MTDGFENDNECNYSGHSYSDVEDNLDPKDLDSSYLAQPSSPLSHLIPVGCCPHAIEGHPLQWQKTHRRIEPPSVSDFVHAACSLADAEYQRNAGSHDSAYTTCTTKRHLAVPKRHSRKHRKPHPLPCPQVPSRARPCGNQSGDAKKRSGKPRRKDLLKKTRA